MSTLSQVLVCPRCQRVNPREASFCHHDGVVLRQGAGPGGVSAAQLPREFVFPSGRRCRSFDDLVVGCQYEWEDARDLLRRGELARYLAGIGRMDLARAAQEAQAQPDPDIALYNFVGSLPATQVQGPRLDISPARVVLNPVRTGEQRQVRLTVANRGKGLLQGKLAVTEGGRWLTIADARLPGEDAPDGAARAAGNGSCPLKTAREQLNTREQFDHVIVNDDVERATAELLATLEAELEEGRTA